MMFEAHMSQHRLVQVSILITRSGQRQFVRMENNFLSGQQAELSAGQIGGARCTATDQGDEIPCLIPDLSCMASKW